MDPDAQTMASWASHVEAATWTGMRRGLVLGLNQAMGDPESLREIVAIPAKEWDAAVAQS